MGSDKKPVALVTGASRGIGRAIALELAANGMRIAVHFGSNRQKATETLRELEGHGHSLHQADFFDPSAPEALLAAVLGKFGRTDVLVNNAGIFEQASPVDASLEEWREHWDRTIAANLAAPAHLSFLAAQQMKRQGGGRIVNISSRGAFRGEPTAPAYGAAKAGLNSLGQSLAKALASHGVFVFTVAPGWVETDMADPYLHGDRGAEIIADIPLGRAAAPQEIANLVAWLAAAAPPSMTGCIIDANGASYLRT